jgi:1-acyl-sn-glycerol-3-phosphate acyltransferase
MFYSLMQALRYSVLGIDLLLVTGLAYLLSFLPRSWTRSFYPALFRVWCRTFVRALGVDLRLHQKNQRPLPRHYLLIANHPSAFEDIGVPALFPVHSLAKEEVRDWWVAGRLSEAAGTIYVKREERESRRDAYEQIRDALLRGESVVIYPEGGCKGRRIFQEFRYGPFELSLETGVPILPVFIHYESQDDFEWGPNQILPQKIWHILTSRNKRANYYVYDALEPRAFADKEAYMQRAHQLYLDWQARYLD